MIEVATRDGRQLAEYPHLETVPRVGEYVDVPAENPDGTGDLFVRYEVVDIVHAPEEHLVTVLVEDGDDDD